MKSRVFAFALLIATSLHAQTAATPDDQAKFLAGLPVTGTPLEALAKESAWVQHSKEFDKAWDGLEKKQLSKIREWVPGALGAAATDSIPLFYMFSGPDFLYANTFFPGASTYVFCGIEPVGSPPDVAKLPPAALAASLHNLRESLDAVLSFSFFITSKMKTDLQATALTGTVPVLYVFLAREGCHVDSVELVGLDDSGEFVTEKAKTPGVKILFTKNGGGAQQTLYYFSSDLSNSGIKAHGGFIKFCDKLGKGNSFLKAASYLMHLSEFTAVRDFLLTHSTTLLQDDSGMPMKNFDHGLWDIHYYGRYPGPIERFKQFYQRDLETAITSYVPPALPFSYGYRWRANESHLVIVKEMKEVPKALPVTDAK